MERLRLVREHIRQIVLTRLERLQKAPEVGAHAMVRLLARIMGIGPKCPRKVLEDWENSHAQGNQEAR